MAKCSISLACKLCTHVFKSEGITPAFWETEKRQGRLRGLLLSTFKAMEAGSEFDLVSWRCWSWMIPNGCFTGCIYVHTYTCVYIYIIIYYIYDIHLYPYTSMLDGFRMVLLHGSAGRFPKWTALQSQAAVEQGAEKILPPQASVIRPILVKDWT